MSCSKNIKKVPVTGQNRDLILPRASYQFVLRRWRITLNTRRGPSFKRARNKGERPYPGIGLRVTGLSVATRKGRCGSGIEVFALKSFVRELDI